MENNTILQDASQPANVSDAAPVYKQHKRNYQACDACRERKTKCYQGDPNDPRPPCLKCQREQRECVFAAVRRKRKKTDNPKEEDGEVQYNQEGQPQARRRYSIGSNSTLGSPHDEYPQTDGRYGLDPKEDEEVINQGAFELSYGRITSSHDAMLTLVKAGQTVEQSANKIKLEEEARLHPEVLNGHSTGSTQSHGPQNSYNLDPALKDSNIRATSKDPQTLRIWDRLRVVQAGWFTAEEAIDFIDYYFQYLAPQTPITHPDLRDLTANPNLLSEEPMLTLTLLTIASRYMKVTGPGAVNRSMMIHEKLWQTLQNMTTRAFWSQEQFGGGFCKAGARDTSPEMENRSKLRSLGTIESLLLLCEFHPRAMHFPPSDLNDDILEPDEATLELRRNRGPGAHLPGKSAQDGWLETAIRSDRMSWSLICFAHTIACELGVFGTFAMGGTERHLSLQHSRNEASLTQRADRIGRLLFIFMTQACGRWGLPSLLPKERIDHYMAETGIKNYYAASDARIQAATSMDEIIQQYWTEAIAINKYCNDELFPSKEKNSEYISNGHFSTKLQYIVPILTSWEKRLWESRIPQLTKIILSIEVNYFQCYVNGIAFQHLLEQYGLKANKKRHTDGLSPTSSDSSHLSEVYSKNLDYVKHVREAYRKIFAHVLEMARSGALRHTPVRTHFRIVSAGGFFSKSFLVGIKRREMERDIRLVKDAVKALYDAAPDDVHLSLRWTEVLEKIAKHLEKGALAFEPVLATSPTQSSSVTARQTSLPIAGHARMIRKTRTGSFTTPTYIGAPNSGLSVFPPPQGMYPPPRPQDIQTFNSPIQSDTDYSPHPTPQYGSFQDPQFSSQAEQQNEFIDGSNTEFPNSMPSGEDWMALPLDAWVNENGFQGLGNGRSFGNPLGLEAHNNFNLLNDMTEGWPINQQQNGSRYQ